MNAGIDWLRRQPFSTRLVFSGAFASISIFAYFMDRIWPWGIIMAVLPLVIGKRSSLDEEFSREVKETGEAPPVALRCELKIEDLELLLTRIGSAAPSSFGTDKIRAVLDGARSLGVDEEKKFQYVVLYAARPTSLQLTLRRKTGDDFEFMALSDPELIGNLTSRTEKA